MNRLSDNALMLKVKAGDIHKLGILYERYKKRLFGFYYQMNKDVGLSEDLVQNVFVKILQYKHTYKEDSKFIVWLFQIARNTNYDHYKKNKKHRHKDINAIEYRVGSVNNIEETIDKSENIMILKKALEFLSQEKRELIMLSKFKELKYKEIGEIIGCTEGAARTKVYRVLNELREFFFAIENKE